MDDDAAVPVTPTEMDDDEYNKMIGLHKPGSIKRVKMKNFLTYESVEFNCGPRLNIICGPNGTGKSSILCALCLGLGGGPKDLGRADDARQFITHEKDEAMIEIELEPLKNGKVHILKRKIERSKGGQNGRGASTFYINDEKVTAKAVKELVTKKYHTAVDNLCQFLPQDRVGNFSGFGPQDLLVETEKSMSGNGQLYEHHQKLIAVEADLKVGGNEVETFQAKLKRLEADNERLEREKERMEEREEAEHQLNLLNSKFVWLKYDALREAAKELKLQKDAAKEKLKVQQQKLQPLEEEHANLATEKRRCDSRYKTLEANMKKALKEQEKQCGKAETHQDAMDDTINELNHIDAVIRQEAVKMEKARAHLKKLQNETENLPSEEDVNAAFDEAKAESAQIRPLLDDAKRKLSRAHQTLKDMHEEKKREETKLARMNDEKTQRKNKVYQRFPELRKIEQWLDQNRTKFRRPVWGPIACEIVTKSNNAAAFIEFHVPNATLKSFVVECKTDYDLLYQEVRRGLRTPINILMVENGILKQIDRPYSANKMSILKKQHGVSGYLDDSFTAPDAILQALRNSASVHSVLVGTTKTQASIDNKGLLDYLSEPEVAGQGLRKYAIFASKGNRSFRYQGNVSRYSKKIAMSQDELRPPHLLKPGVNPEHKKELEDKIEKMDEEMREREQSHGELRANKDDLERQAQEARGRVKNAKDAQGQIASHHKSLERAQNKIANLEKADTSDGKADKTRLLKKIQGHMKSMVTALEAHADQQGQIMQLTFSQAGVRLNQDSAAAAMRKAEENLADAKRGFKQAEEEAVAIGREFTAKKNAMKEMKTLAENEAPLEDDDGNPLPLKAELEALTVTTLAETEAAMEEASAKVNGIDANPEVIRQYEARKQEIEEIRAQLTDLTDSKESKLSELQKERAPWEQALDRAVNEVNTLFSKYMQDLSCAGEVKLKKGDGDRRGDDDSSDTGNFKEWGIEIRVKFREGSKLQALSARVQSGGERSVSTIMYLMALQDLMTSPFRCVDEINQGLDERNERLVFKRIVENSTQPPRTADLTDHSGQYFLITPKVLPNLDGMEEEALTVLNIMNGPYGMDDSKEWDVDGFVEAAPDSDDDEQNEVSDDEGDENSSASRRNAESGRARKQRRLS